MKSIEEMNAELRAAVEARLAVSEARSEANTALKSALDFRGDKPTASPWIHPHTKPLGSGFCWVMCQKSRAPQLAYYLSMNGSWRDAYAPSFFLEPSFWMPLIVPPPPETTPCP